MKTKLSVFVSLALSILISSAAWMTTQAFAANIVENDPDFNPIHKNVIKSIPWIEQSHTGFDDAFTPERALDATGEINDAHLQLIGDTAYFFGYYTNPLSDYIYYRESDPTEKTFSFSMNFFVYPFDSNIPKPQTWHSLRSMGFLVNCVENDDGTISGYYFSFEQSNYQNKIVIRMLNRINLNEVYSDSIRMLSGHILAEMPLESSMQTSLYKIKSSNQAFSVKRDGVEIFSLNLATAATSHIPLGYTGGNDFGFYAGYIGEEWGHFCSELSFAKFSNIRILTKTVIPESSLEVRFIDYNTRDKASPTQVRAPYVSTGYAGQGYTVFPPATIGAYTYVSANAPLSGNYADDPSVVVLYYKKTPSEVEWKGESDKAVAVNVAATASGRTNASGIKIPSNTHSADFPGIYFIWDSKQKDNGYLKVAAWVFEKYESFTLTSKESNTYWDFLIVPQAGQKKTADDCYVFFIPKVYNNKNINMVFVDELKR